MPSLDLRSTQLNVTFPAGHPFTVALNGPAGWLDSRTFTATLNGLSLDVSEDGDQLLIAVDAVTSEAVTQVARFELVGNVDGETLVGDWAPRTDGTGSAVTETTVTLGSVADVEVTLILLANPAIVGGGEGGVVNEVAAATGIEVDDTDPTAPVISAAPAIAAAATDATTKANAAQAAAIATAATDATTKANAAQAAAISAAATDATTKASTAQTAAISAAATDATTKANAAQAAAVSTASTDATTKANAAQSAATSAAAADATTKANAAQSAATSAAATDATTKANAAQAHAVQRANHTGAQAISTVTGLQTALDAKALAADLDTLEADVAALPELASANPAELSLSTVGLVTTATLTAEIARQSAINNIRPKPPVGDYWVPFAAQFSTQSPVLNRINYFPVYLPAGTIDRIGIDVVTATATSSIRLAVYAPTAAFLPGALIAEAPTPQDGNAAGVGTQTISAVIPTDGVYFLASNHQTAVAPCRTLLSNDPLAMPSRGPSTPATMSTIVAGYHTSSVTGVMPSTAAAPAYGNTIWPVFTIRYSA